MLKRDFIMVQIEELGKVIAQIINQRNTDAARTNPDLIGSVYTSLKIDHEYMMDHSPKEIRLFLDGEDNAGLQRMEIAAKLLIEEAYLHTEKQHEIREKAKEILQYIQLHDITFSIERVQLLNELADQLS